jgi:hypothetical protein
MDPIPLINSVQLLTVGWKNNFLVSIGADICSQKKQDERGHILNEVQGQRLPSRRHSNN